MAARTIDCVQGSPEWVQARLGIVTSSEFATVLAKGRDGGASKTRATYLAKLVSERWTGEAAENYTNPYFDRGKAMEPTAREEYAIIHDVEPELVGFVVDDDLRAGCSPDSLIGADGALEIKTAAGHLMVGYLTGRGGFPAEHIAQCQGVLWLTGRDWIDIAIYWPNYPLFTKRAGRDEAYIRSLASAVAQFNEEADALVERIRSYGEMPTNVVRRAFSDSLAVSA